ncbi:MAG: SirB2 family protein [Steroidobacteraceae bacterium]
MTGLGMVLLLHILCAMLSPVLFSLRAWRAVRGLDPAVGALRWAPHVVDTVLFMAGASLAWQLAIVPGRSPWLTAKLVALLIYIVLGHLAVRRARARSTRIVLWVLALAVIAYIYAVALTASPTPWA